MPWTCSLSHNFESRGRCPSPFSVLSITRSLPPTSVILLLLSSPLTVMALNQPASSSSSREFGYCALCLCWARVLSDSATRQRVVPTDRHSFVALSINPPPPRKAGNDAQTNKV